MAKDVLGLDDPGLDDDDGDLLFEDMVDTFIVDSFMLIDSETNTFGTKEALLSQISILTQLALLGTDVSPGLIEDMQLMVGSWISPDESPLDPPDTAWINMIVKTTMDFLHKWREVANHEHRANCDHCNPELNRNN